MSTLTAPEKVIHYTRGCNKYDNQPEQKTVMNFSDFCEAILADCSLEKGKAYFCSPLSYGPHRDLTRYPNHGHYRARENAEPRRFLPMDFDGFRSPAAFIEAFKYLKQYSGFGYTTASSTVDAPRARAVIELTKAVSREGGIAVGNAFQAQMQNDLGDDIATFDESVYRGEQPVYNPLINAEIFRFDGQALDVDALLANVQPTIINKPLFKLERLGTKTTEPETEENIARVKSALAVLDPNCDRALWRNICWAVKSLGWQCGEQLARAWSIGEFSHE
ncbi:MAG: hypothetical protein HOP26_07350 [Methylotenera sp.]|nr:hypothetical protein [Methylotenera sp.]